MKRRTAITAMASSVALPFVAAPTQSSPPGDGCTNVRDYGAVGDGVADDTAALQSAHAAAQTSAARCLYLPAGVYRVVLSGGKLFDCSAPGLTIHGDGPALSRIAVDAVALTNHIRLIHFRAANQTVEDLAITFGTGFSGAYDLQAVEVYTGAISWHVANLDIAGVWGYGPAGGVGVGCYQADATPQFGLCEDTIVHDCPRGGGFGTNARHNTFRRCVVLRVGDSTTQHGFYTQGGATVFDQCYAEACAGMSYHAHKQNQTLDASGDEYRSCVSVNPGLKHMLVDSYTPPGGQPLTRYVTVTNCLFRGSAEGLEVKVPAVIEGCTFEDVRKSGQNAISVSAGAQGSIVRGNMLKNSYGIVLGAPATAEGNTLDSLYGGVGINAAATGATVRGNRVTITGISGNGATGIMASAANVRLLDNDVTVTAPGACLKAQSSATGLIARGNVLTALGGAWWQDVPSPFGGVLDNVLR